LTHCDNVWDDYSSQEFDSELTVEDFTTYAIENTIKKKNTIKCPEKCGENNPAFGKHWYTNGIVNRYEKECPAGFHPGRVGKGVTAMQEASKQVLKGKPPHNSILLYCIETQQVYMSKSDACRKIGCKWVQLNQWISDGKFIVIDEHVKEIVDNKGLVSDYVVDGKCPPALASKLKDIILDLRREE